MYTQKCTKPQNNKGESRNKCEETLQNTQNQWNNGFEKNYIIHKITKRSGEKMTEQNLEYKSFYFALWVL